MGLLDTLKQVKEAGFDPKKDSVSTSSRLESGTYPVRLKKVERGVNKANQVQLSIQLEVVSGDFKDRTENIFLCFEDGLPEFALEKNGRTLLKLAEFAKVTFKKNDLEDEEATAEALQRGIGNQFLMKLTVSPNKKNPDFPYRNYDFESLENDLPDNIEEDDLPF